MNLEPKFEVVATMAAYTIQLQYRLMHNYRGLKNATIDLDEERRVMP
jgi:hypothetical protein